MAFMHAESPAWPTAVGATAGDSVRWRSGCGPLPSLVFVSGQAPIPARTAASSSISSSVFPRVSGTLNSDEQNAEEADDSEDEEHSL